jgi:predicted transcriptional regulator
MERKRGTSLTIRLPAIVKKKLKEVAKNEERSVAQIVRRALRKYLGAPKRS